MVDTSNQNGMAQSEAMEMLTQTNFLHLLLTFQKILFSSRYVNSVFTGVA